MQRTVPLVLYKFNQCKIINRLGNSALPYLDDKDGLSLQVNAI